MSTPTKPRLSKEALDARRPLSIDEQLAADHTTSHRDPCGARAGRTVRSMSSPTADPSDFEACDDHQNAYPIGGSCPECDRLEARGMAKRWAIRRSLTPGEALSIGRTALLNRHGIDCLTACDVHPRERLVSLEDRGLLSGTRCQPCDGDGFNTGEDEVEGWELTQLGTPLDDDEDERLRAWVRERVAEYIKGCLAYDGEWAWTSSTEGDREAMAGWVAVDLGLGDEVDFATALALCTVACGWPS